MTEVMDSTVLFEKVFKETKDIRNKLDNMSEEDSKKFGETQFVLPNPMYGKW